MNIEQRLMDGRVLVEVGALREAEAEVARVVAADPGNLDALGLLAKIKHMTGELTQALACWAAVHVRARAALAQAWTGCWGPERQRAVVLATAQRAERTGELAAARVELERLGLDPACVLDPGRLLTLIEIYARLGTADASQAGARVCRHLLAGLAEAGIEKLSLLGALALFEQREELEARFAAAFRRRMHRPSLADLARVAARRYLPLAQLRRCAPEESIAERLGDREAGIVYALRGRPERACERFGRGRTPLDRIYAIEIAGDDARAMRELLAMLHDGPDDPAIAGWLVDRHAVPVVARYLRRHHARTRALLEASCTLDPRRPETWRRLAALHQLVGHRELAARHATRAEAVARSNAPAIGRVLAAGVIQLGGGPKGLLHEIWVHRIAAPQRGGDLADEDILGNLTPELRAGIRNTFVAVREYVRSKLPHLTADLDDYRYVYKVPKDDAPSGGASAGLPSALALLSVFLQRPIDPSIASSGAAISEAHDSISIGRIGDADYKAKAAYHANARMLILPIANRDDLEASRMVPRQVCSSIVRYARDLDTAARLVFGDDLFTRP